MTDRTTSYLQQLQPALSAINKVMLTGAVRYPHEPWRTMLPSEHIQHAKDHLEKLAAGDTSEPHLEHALTRLAMAKTVASGGPSA